MLFINNIISHNVNIWRRGAMVARWIPVPKVACSIHVAFIRFFVLDGVEAARERVSFFLLSSAGKNREEKC